MSSLLHCRGLSKAFGTQFLFEDLTLSIGEGARQGIIGPNGVGKSTLLKILVGQEPPDEGEVLPRKGLRLAIIPQMAKFDETRTVFQIVEQAAIEAKVPPEERVAAVNIVLGKTGFTDLEVTVATLSGGWRKRLTLAQGLVAQPELVLFDEPTNHLDVSGVLWLESLLETAPFAWVLVSHDRYFLERTTEVVAELNPVFPDGILTVQGNYSHFLKRRAEFIASQEQYRESLSNKVRRETEWLRQGVKARTTKAKYRIDSAHALIDELETVKARGRTQETRIEFSSSQRKTRKLVEVKGLKKTLGDFPIVNKLDYVLSPGKRVGLLGVNGTGKTTMLRLFGGELEPDQGSVHHVSQLKVVYFDQNRSQLDPTVPLKNALAETGDAVVYRGQSIHVLSWAKRFKFNHDQMPIPVGRLSGGEQARLLIAKLMLQPADLLLLDEPTNDLDIPTLEVLEESLLDFPGAVVLVTHDRYMLSRVCDTFLGLNGKGDCSPFADYNQWERTLLQTGKSSKPTSAAKQKPKPKETVRRKLSYMEQREYDHMEEAILEAETQLEERQEAAEDPAIASDGAKLLEAHTALAAAEKEVARLYERWAELEAATDSATK